MIAVPINAKIVDITHADTLKHFLDLETPLSESRRIIQLIIMVQRVAGSGAFIVYPGEGTLGYWLPDGATSTPIMIADGTQRLQYALEVANDDWDIFSFGYMVEG